MTTVLKDLFTSKKFLAALSAVILYLTGRFGFQLDPAALDRIFAALLVYVGAQGVADVGKSAAAINAVAAEPNRSIEASKAMQRVASTVPMLAVLLLAIGGAVALPACGASQRETTIKTALVTVDTARDSFVAFDASEQSMIVNKATSLDDGKAQLATYRDRRVKIVEAFTVAYRAIAAAATINDDPSIAGLSAALAQLLAAVTTITGGTP